MRRDSVGIRAVFHGPIADPVLSKQNSDGTGAGDGFLDRGDPPKARTKLTSIKESAQTFGAEPSVQVRSGGSVAAGVADKKRRRRRRTSYEYFSHCERINPTTECGRALVR